MTKHDNRVAVLLTDEQKQMLETMAQEQRRSMNQVICLAIERVYQVTRKKIVSGTASAHGKGGMQ